MIKQWIGVAALGLLAMSATAADKYDQVREKLKSLAPDLQIDEINDAPMAGFAEVVTGAQVVYVSLDGKYLIDGTVIDIDSRQNLSDVTKNKARKSLVSAVTTDERFVFAASSDEPKHRITVFTDIDCGYCRRLHQQMADYNALGIEIAYLMFPRAGMTSDSANKAISAWCAVDRNAALTAAKAGQDPEPQQCDNPIAAHFELGRKVGVTGTPAIVMEDGSLLPGYLPPEQLMARLDAVSAAAAAAN